MSLNEYPMGGTATAVSTGPDDATPRFAALDTGSITPSLTNPRKTFDAAKLQELAASIKASGVHQPILVRPLPAARLADTFTDRRPGQPLPSFELVAGERRLRACRLAGVDEIPAMIKHMTDNQVLECQIVENLQRDDLVPLEEAEGYQALIDATGIDKEAIGERIGRSRTYVYGRLKLLDLCQKGRVAMREGKIDHSTGLLIARIPDEKLQLKALKAFTETDYGGDVRMGHRAKLAWIHQNVMLKLKDSRFDIKDASLIPTAGSCETCSKRTGANPDLFSDIDAPDLCTDPPCFHGKEAAHTAAIVEKAHSKGMEVIEGKAALELKPYNYGSGTIPGHTGLDETVWNPKTDEEVPLRKALTKDQLKGNVKLFVDPHTGVTTEVIPEALYEQARAKFRTQADVEKQAQQEAEDSRESAEETRRRLEREYEARWRSVAAERIDAGIKAGLVQQFEPPILRRILFELAGCTAEYGDGDAVNAVLQIAEEAGLDDDVIDAAVTAIPDNELGARICALLLRDEATVSMSYHRTLNPRTPVIDSLAESCDIDLASIKANVQQEMKAAAAERAKDQAPAGKKSKAKRA